MTGSPTAHPISSYGTRDDPSQVVPLATYRSTYALRTNCERFGVDPCHTRGWWKPASPASI